MYVCLSLRHEVTVTVTVRSQWLELGLEVRARIGVDGCGVSAEYERGGCEEYEEREVG